MNNAHCGNLEKLISNMIEKIIEAIIENMLQSFNQLREDYNVHEPNFFRNYKSYLSGNKTRGEYIYMYIFIRTYIRTYTSLTYTLFS